MPSHSEAKAIDDDDEKQQQQQQQQLVCVTGAGGFIWSWLVKELLLRGYRVRGTSRDPADERNSHLLALEGAKERLSLCRANLLDLEDLRTTLSGCHGFFHLASPISNRDPDLMPAVLEGTRNVVNAAEDVGVQCVVFTSSYGAVHMDPNRSPGAVVDEMCWSDYEFCKRTGNLYCCAKMMAEKAAMEEAAMRGVELAVVVPHLTIGPSLQHTLTTSINGVMKYITGAKATYPNAVTVFTDVRNVSRAHHLVYERPEARGRYLCLGDVMHRAQFSQLVQNLFPQYPVPTKPEDDGKPMVKSCKFSNQRLKDLGLEFTPVRESVYDMVISLQQQSHLLLPGAVPKWTRL